MNVFNFSYKGASYNFSLFGKSFDNKELTELFKEFICYNQSEYIQYSFIAADLHEKMKLSLKSENINTLIQSQDDLDKHFNETLKRITKENFKFLGKFFSNRSNFKPRICLKGTYGSNNSKEVVALFRNSTEKNISKCLVEENTGFKYINEKEIITFVTTYLKKQKKINI